MYLRVGVCFPTVPLARRPLACRALPVGEGTREGTVAAEEKCMRRVVVARVDHFVEQKRGVVLRHLVPAQQQDNTRAPQRCESQRSGTSTIPAR